MKKKKFVNNLYFGLIGTIISKNNKCNTNFNSTFEYNYTLNNLVLLKQNPYDNNLFKNLKTKEVYKKINFATNIGDKIVDSRNLIPYTNLINDLSPRPKMKEIIDKAKKVKLICDDQNFFLEYDGKKEKTKKFINLYR